MTDVQLDVQLVSPPIVTTETIAGAPGARGPAGADGDPGPAGADGAPGAPGTPGAPGADGTAGVKGDKGDPGAAGADGAAGAKGDPGVKGDTGAIGPAAADDPRVGLRIAWENDSTVAPNNASENTLATFTIPANSVQPLGGPGGMKWIFSLHALVQNTGAAAANITLRCKVNGTTAIGTSTLSVPNGTGERLVEIEWSLMGDNDYNLNQKARFAISGLMAPPTTTDDLPTRRGYTRGNSIVQATWQAPIVLTITAQWATATGTVIETHGYDVIQYRTTPG